MTVRTVELILACALAVLPNAVATDGTVPAEEFASKASSRIIFGTQLATRDSPVVLVRHVNGSGSRLCTGSVIAPSVVLTAWHCVSRRAENMTVTIDGKRRVVKRVRVHPEVRIDSDGAVYNDVALLQLRRRISIAPLPILLSRPVAIGDSLQIAGYGLTEYQTSGRLLGGVTSVDEVSRDFFVTIFDQPDSNSCSGDSGGPAISGYRDAQGVVRSGIVGITSTGTNPNCFFGDRTNYINLQSPEVIQFIQGYVKDLTVQ